jgi:hypothetical protein
VVDEHTVVLLTKEIDPDFLFLMGQATAVIVEPKSVDTNTTKPVGTGPYKLDNWVKGSSVVLSKWDGHRNAASLKIKRATFRFIADPAAQVAALLAGDVDAFPRVTPRSVPQFKTNPRFQVMASGSRAKTILAHEQQEKAAGRCARAPRHQHGHRPQGRDRGRGRRLRLAHRQLLRAQRPRLCGPDQGQRLRPRQGARPAQGSRRVQPGADHHAAAAAVCAPGWRGDRLHARQGGHQGQAAERGMGAVAVGHLRQQELRHDHHLARGAV